MASQITEGARISFRLATVLSAMGAVFLGGWYAANALAARDARIERFEERLLGIERSLSEQGQKIDRLYYYLIRRMPDSPEDTRPR